MSLYANPNVKPLEGSNHDDFRIRIGSRSFCIEYIMIR